MQILLVILILFISLFASLFTLHLLAKDDLILIRKNISLDTLFTQAFLTIIVGLLCSRFVYVLLNFKIKFLNPLVFLYITHYLGMSLVGGVTGGAVFLFLLLHSKSKITTRAYDLITLAFIASLPFSFMINFLNKNYNMFVNLGSILFYILLFICMTRIFIKGKMKEGSVALASLLFLALSILLQDILIRKGEFLQQVNPEDIFLLGASFVLLFLFMQKQKLLKRVLH